MKPGFASVGTPYGFRRPMLARAQMLEPVGRWTPGAKACLVEAITVGLVTETEAMQAHNISADELNGWRENLRRGGVQDLRLRTIQIRPYRPRVTPAPSFEEAAAAVA